VHRIGFIVPPEFQLLSLAPLTVFELANLPPTGPHYEVHLLSEAGGPIRSSTGVTLETEAFGDPEFDTIIVGSVTAFEMAPSSPAAIAFLQAAARASRRTVSICSGAFMLAEAGLLDGRRATTHWFHAATFRARFPAVQLEEDRIFINDGPVWTSAGMSAGTDLALAIIDKDLGQDAAKLIAQLLVVHQRRMGGQSQHSALIDMMPKSDRIAAVLNHIRRNLNSRLSVEDLASVAALSPRQFGRAFHAETGQSPARAVEQLRLEAARFMMEAGRHSVKVVAEETGFADRERMRRAFVRTFGLPPQAFRRRAQPDSAGMEQAALVS
jgi:transcriptional regulator GlxA family with amidase domain